MKTVKIVSLASGLAALAFALLGFAEHFERFGWRSPEEGATIWWILAAVIAFVVWAALNRHYLSLGREPEEHFFGPAPKDAEILRPAHEHRRQRKLTDEQVRKLATNLSYIADDIRLGD